MEITENIPQHVGIIMDGNGRWAKKRLLPRTVGHRAGGKSVEKIADYAFSRGVKALSLYAFSSENWSRPQEEVEGIFSLIEEFLKNNVKRLIDNGIRFTATGNLEGLPDKLKQSIMADEERTAKNTGGILNIAINYGGMQDIAAAFGKLAAQGKTDATLSDVRGALSTAKLPPLDLIIRTGGEKRLSNFMLFECAYSELYFTDTLWPDFNQSDFDAALKDYSLRKRNFGGLHA